MKNRYRLLYRGERGTFFCFDNATRKRTGLQTKDRDAAEQIVLAKNQALRQPVLNLQIAKAYLAGTDNGVTTRTWQNAIEALINTKQGENQHRWKTAAKDKAFGMLLPQVIIETKGELLLKVLQMGTVSTNVFLRRLHNFCVDMNWLPWPLIPKRQWPAVKHGEKRGITLAEHLAIVARENNPERKAFYKLAWHLGASQSDLAGLKAEDVDWEQHVTGKRHPQSQAVARANALAVEQKKRFFHWFIEFPDVFERGGFDCILGNPPFLMNRKLSGTFGDTFLNWVKYEYAPAGSVDLVTYFFRRIQHPFWGTRTV
jgi:hypothetical protein